MIKKSVVFLRCQDMTNGPGRFPVNDKTMKTKCYSVRLTQFSKYSPKCYRAITSDNHLELIPVSQYFGVDNSSEQTHWVSEWFIRKMSLPYNPTRCVWFDEHGNMVDDVPRHTMSHDDLKSLYAHLERFVADLTVKEALEFQSAIKGVQTIMHRRMNES